MVAVSSAGAQGGWAPPGSAVPGAPGDATAAPRQVEVAALRGSAGVAVARGDDRWPDTDGSRSGGHGVLEDLEPVGVGGVLDGGFHILRNHFGLLVGLAASIYLPLQLLDLWVAISAGLSAEIDSTPLLSVLASTDSQLPLTWVVFALRVLALSVLGMAAGIVMRDSLAGVRRRPAAVVRRVARRWWVALLVPVLCIPVKLAFGCLGYIGFFLGDALLMCASVVAGAEGKGPLASFARSWRLGARSFGTALGVSLGAFAISVVLQFALYLGPALLTSVFVPSEAVILAVQQAAMLSLVVTQPLTAAIAARGYVELRCRSEALDLALRRHDLGLVA